MTDIFDPDKRSQIMSRIRSTGTAPEAMLYQIVRLSLGHRWRIRRNARDLPGQPDIVVPTLSLAIFADGCFFHQCPDHGRIPDTNRSYWETKLAGNVRRDAENREKLRKLGYSVWRYWEPGLARLGAVTALPKSPASGAASWAVPCQRLRFLLQAAVRYQRPAPTESLCCSSRLGHRHSTTSRARLHRRNGSATVTRALRLP
ncbi:MAG: very short patch repair endonuclease [Gammaproteobacteria bacterium]|nr:very short patch repair endonuclease [Gammaproteobacteria bacterium]